MNGLPIEYTGRKTWGRKVYRFTETWCYVIPSSYLRIEVNIPYQFYFDGASVPWPLHYLFPRALKAAAVHDYLCRRNVSRFISDAVFRHIMAEDRVRGRIVMYYAVRAYWIAWGKWFQKG